MNIKIVYYKNGSHLVDTYEKAEIEGEFVIGDGPFNEYMGVKTDTGFTMIPKNTIISFDCDEIPEFFLASFRDMERRYEQMKQMFEADLQRGAGFGVGFE
jgi:hypothetical protein|tara:strand:- start:311 stop:610 length:300 start_codon:yes stop_codon:yes gene_type:complete